jgi:Spx/MgsR family transcriptional regulator
MGMTRTMYGIRNCETVKKARAWLDQRGVDYDFHDYKLSGIDTEHLSRWCDEIGWEKVLNRAGTTFRKLPEAEKENLSREKALALMLTQPSMIKRPVLELRGRVVVGFDPELYKTLKW